MWFGMLIREPGDGDEDLVTIVAYGREAERRIRVTGAPDGMEQCMTLIRATQAFGADFAPPRCPHCDDELDAPDIDANVREENEL